MLQYDLVRNFSDKAKQSIDTLARRVSGENWVYTSAKENLNLEKAVYMMIELVRFFCSKVHYIIKYQLLLCSTGM